MAAAQAGGEEFGDAAAALAIDEGDGGRVLQVDAQATVLLADLDVEVGVQLLRRARVVGGAAGGKHRERAAAQQVVHAAARGVAQARDFLAREDVEAAARVDAGVDGRERGGFGVFRWGAVSGYPGYFALGPEFSVTYRTRT